MDEPITVGKTMKTVPVFLSINPELKLDSGESGGRHAFDGDSGAGGTWMMS